MKKIRFAVIGGGSWGTTIADLLATKGFKVKLWAREREVVESINSKNINEFYLPQIKLSKNLRAFEDINAAISGVDVLINAVPVQFIRKVFNQIKERKNIRIVLNLSKGIEIDTLKIPSEILTEFFKPDIIYTLSGPNFATEIAQKKPAATTIAGKDRKTRILLQKIFSTPYFRVYENDDIIGCEIAGAVKNVVAIAAGISDAMGFGNNAKAALITRGLNEIRNLGKTKGAKDITFLGLSGLGDLVLTCNSNISRNYTFGYNIAKYRKINQGLYIAEGFYTAKAVYNLSKKLAIQMPISHQVYMIIYKKKDPKKALTDLMSRKPKAEF